MQELARPLTRSKIATEIYPKYNPLRERGLIDDVRIIAPLKLNFQAQKYVEDDCRFAFTTKDELECRIIDFRRYLHSLRSIYMEGGLDRYYIHPVLEDGTES